MAKCPRCNADIEKPVKTWRMKPRNKENAKEIEVQIYVCSNCGKRFRKGIRV